MRVKRHRRLSRWDRVKRLFMPKRRPKGGLVPVTPTLANAIEAKTLLIESGGGLPEDIVV
jgi:hypothetical protein